MGGGGGQRCTIYIDIYPPTPADARGSAPGNNTFDSCFGLLPQPAQQQQLLLLLLLLLWVSEVTLGIFGVQFWGFSVLQRHGVSLLAGDFFHGVFHPGTTTTTTTTPADARGSAPGNNTFDSCFGLLPQPAQQQQLLLLLLLLLWVSEVTLGIFGVQFWGFSVLQRHGVSLPAGDFFHGVFHPGTTTTTTITTTTTTMGFRSYIRHFRGAILGLLRPSEAWCFPAGR